MLKPNSKLVLEYLRANDGKDITAADIAEGTGLEVKQVNGIVTSAFQKKGYTVRVEGEKDIIKEDGSTGHKAVKYIKLTDEGRTHDFDAEDAE